MGTVKPASERLGSNPGPLLHTVLAQAAVRRNGCFLIPFCPGRAKQKERDIAQFQK